MSLYPLWTHEMPGIDMPEHLLRSQIQLPPALVQQWIDSDDMFLGGLLFPRGPFDMASQDPFVQILKTGVVCRRRGNRTLSAIYDEIHQLHQPAPAMLEEGSEEISRLIPRPEIGTHHTPDPPSLKVDLTIFVFRRDLDPSADLHPFDPSGAWHPVSYLVWTDLYKTFAPTMQSECAALGNPALPIDACTLFRRVMRTHFRDCGILFGRIWWDFCLGAMTPDDVNLRSFMRGMLTDMFMAYHALPVPPPVRTLFNPRTYDPGQRMCAHCLVLMVGQHRMMRCPCGQVYYCNAECQRAHWRAHKVVCARKGGGRK